MERQSRRLTQFDAMHDCETSQGSAWIKQAARGIERSLGMANGGVSKRLKTQWKV
jgi:hypothetical protein